MIVKSLATILLFIPFVASAQESQNVPEMTEQAPAVEVERRLEIEIAVSTTDEWTDTGINLHAGDKLKFKAKIATALCDALGDSAGVDPSRDLPLSDAPFGALIGRLGPFGTVPRYIGREAEFKMETAGHLFLGVNTDGEVHCSDGFLVDLTLEPAPGRPQTARTDWEIDELIDRIPRRVQDGYGNPGDMVNFVLIGPKDSMLRSFAAAGWVIVDRRKVQAALHAVMESVSQQDYLEVPMSTLVLLGRGQDYGWARAEPYKVLASRHHFRIWEAPFKIHGQTLWLGAGTHDVGFNRDHRNGHLTHKIDPAIDGERNFIVSTLREAGAVQSVIYELPSRPFTIGQNATGESVVSDGHIAVVTLSGLGTPTLSQNLTH